jgi:hypothetical protein
MNFQITPDRCYCSFGNGIVYEFVPYESSRFKNSCWLCAFYRDRACLTLSVECSMAPCQSGLRRDKNTGFWQKCETLDFQQFTKMLQNGG